MITIWKRINIFTEQQSSENSAEDVPELGYHANTEETADEDEYYSQDTSEDKRDAATSEDDDPDLEEENNQELNADPEIEQLRDWAVESGTNLKYVDKLLNIFRPRLIPSLPKSSKTFLKTKMQDMI